MKKRHDKHTFGERRQAGSGAQCLVEHLRRGLLRVLRDVPDDRFQHVLGGNISSIRRRFVSPSCRSSSPICRSAGYRAASAAAAQHLTGRRRLQSDVGPLLLELLEQRGIDLECLARSQSKLQLLMHACDLLPIDQFDWWRSISNGFFAGLGRE